jgi:long-chain fatty acid transport protein
MCSVLRALEREEGASMRKIRVSSLAIVLFVLCGSLAFANGLNLNGVGAKSVSMGGAFIGLADDGSAVFWNPGGLTQIQKVTLYGFETTLMPTGTYKYAAAGIDAKTDGKVYPSGAGALLAPVGKRLVVGLSFYVPAGTGARWNGNDLKTLTRGAVYQWESLNKIITFAPAVAVKLSDKVSLGATFNVNQADLDLKRGALGQYTEDISGNTIGATFGLHVHASERLRVGLTVRTPSNLKLDGTATMAGAAAVGFPTTANAKREATWPIWIGGGVAVKASEKLTLTGDVQFTHWKRIQTIDITYDQATWQAARKVPQLAPAFEQSFVLNWHDAAQVRVGGDFALNKAWSLRAGYYYDPSPSPQGTLNILLPEATYNVGTVGVGFKKGALTLDLCMEALFGKDRESTTEAGVPARMPGIHGMRILVPNVSVSYGF